MVTKSDLDLSGWQEAISLGAKGTCDEYYSIFKNKASDAIEKDEQEKAAVFRLLAGITSMWLDPSQNSDDPFHPMMTFTNGSRTMLIDDIAEEDLDVFAETVETIVDPEMQARIADILWIRRRNYQMAILAAKAYLEAAKKLKGSEHWLTPTSWRLERAIQLAQRVRNKTLLTEIFSEIEITAQNVVTDDDLLNFVLIAMMNLMQEYKYQPSDILVYTSLAERGAQTAAHANNWYLARAYWEVKSRWYSETQPEFRQARIEAAETYVKEAEIAANDTPSRHIAASAFVEDAIEAMRKIGNMQGRVTQLQNLLIEYGRKSLDEMGEVSVPIDLTQVATKAKEQVRGKSLYNALFVLMKLGNSPNVAELRLEAAKSVAEHPVTFRVSSRTFNDMGKVVNRRGTIDEDEEATIEHETYQHAARSQDILAVGVIEPAVHQILLEHRVRVRDLFPLVFDNPFIPPGREEIYARGLHAGLLGDFLVAAHLLIPQIENSLRYILQAQGVITSGLDQNMIQDEYTLDRIIYINELKDILGEDIVFDLKGLLVKRPGSNIRNLLSHGLMDYEAFFSARLIYLWWLILRLWGLPKLDFLLKDKGANSDAPTGEI